MRQIIIDEFGPAENLRLTESPLPVPGPGEILVKVRYAGLNPIDYKMRDGSSGRASMLTLPTTLGREFVGELAAASEELDLAPLGLRVGGLVFGMRNHEDPRGCYAEFITVAASDVAPVPESATAERLPAYGGLALAGLTALAAVDECARVRRGETVLVHGGTGGVGQLIIPLARAAGADSIWATGRAANAARITELGATPLSYDELDWQTALQEATSGEGVDVVIDTHYFNTFLPSLEHLRPGGRIVVLPTLADVTPARDRGIDVSIPAITPTRERLERLADGLETGELSIEVSGIVKPEEIVEAHRQLESGHTRGKLVFAFE